jgi:hypothetical protein
MNLKLNDTACGFSQKHCQLVGTPRFWCYIQVFFLVKSVSLVMWIHGKEHAWHGNQAGGGNHSGTVPGRTSYHLTKQKPILLVSLCHQQHFFPGNFSSDFDKEKGLLKVLCDFMSLYFFSHPKCPLILHMVARSSP